MSGSGEVRSSRLGGRSPRFWALAVAALLIASALAVAMLVYIPKTSMPVGEVVVTGASYRFVYSTNDSISNTSPLSGGLSWSGGSPDPIEASAGSAAVLHVNVDDNSSSNCTVTTVTIGVPFGLLSVVVSNNATDWQPGSLPTTVQGEMDRTVWNTELALSVDLPSTPGSYLIHLEFDGSC
jgi:hypothetical protein